MDHEIPDEDRQRIIAIVKQETRAIGLHDLRTRRSGSRLFIQFHLELDGELYLREAHQIADKLEQEVAALFEDAEVIIHQDPVSVAR
jgi:ferrous-iron efflux pump FieF